MNRDTTIIQVAILFIIIAVLGVAIFNKQRNQNLEETENTNGTGKTVVVQNINEGSAQEGEEDVGTGETANVIVNGGTGDTITNSFTERINSPKTNLVKQYFAAIANEDYGEACRVMSDAQCADIRPGAVENFSREFDKLKNGYEYVNVKDYEITAPSGKSVVCVKYSYRYKNDPNPQLISEIMSFYLRQIDGNWRITNRVCEKKYKEGSGIRPCPIEPSARFCVNKIK